LIFAIPTPPSLFFFHAYTTHLFLNGIERIGGKRGRVRYTFASYKPIHSTIGND